MELVLQIDASICAWVDLKFRLPRGLKTGFHFRNDRHQGRLF